MRTVRPILNESDLPPLNSACERPDVDAKAEVNTADTFELAKDVAALANGRGGNLIIGMFTKGSVFAGRRPLLAARAREVQDAYEKTVRDHCRPAPFVAPHHIIVDGGVILVVFVAASALGVVGVSLRANSEKTHSADGWVFPIRAASHTRPLAPDQFATIEDVSARLAFSRLRTIPPEGWKVVDVWANEVDGGSTHYFAPHAGSLDAIDEEGNSVQFTVAVGQMKTPRPLSIPAEWVDSVWKTQEGRWQVALICMLRQLGNGVHGVPRDAGPQRASR